MRVERERERKSRDSPRAETEPNFRRKYCAVRAREKEMLLLRGVKGRRLEFGAGHATRPSGCKNTKRAR